ncbi:MAG: PAS domain S-box protein [Syntrophobacteraceae bacterium]
MKPRNWTLGRTLASRIILHLFLTILVLGVCLYFYNLRCNVCLLIGLILTFSAVLLYFFLNRAVQLPLRKIIDDVRAGLPPQYRGIEEFSFLSANIEQMMRALKESEQTVRDIATGLGEGVYVMDGAGTLVFINQEAERLLGWKQEELLGRLAHDLFHRHGQDRGDCPFLTFTSTGDIYRTEEDFFRRKDGSILPVACVAAPLKKEGAVRGAIVAFRDVTERRQVERERLANLKYFESMDKVNRAIQGSEQPEKIMKDLLDVVLSIFECDRAFLMYPCDPEAQSWTVPVESNRPECAGACRENLTMPMDQRVAETARILLASEGPVIFGPGGRYEPSGDVSQRFGILSFMAMAIYPKIGSPWEFGLHQCTHAREWTSEQKILFEAIGRRLADTLSILLSYRDLRKNEEFLDKIVKHIPNTICVKDAKTLAYLRCNGAGEHLFGYPCEELLGKTDHDLFPREIADNFTAKDLEALESGKLVDIPEEVLRNRRNQTRFLHTQKIPIPDENGVLQYLLCISEDITERKKLEEQFRQAQKMEAVGRLAGGVAHDFNNMLSVILGYSELIASRLQPLDPILGPLNGVRSAANRSAELTRQLLAFSRKQTIAPRRIDLNEHTNTMESLLTRIIGEDIALTFELSPQLWPVYMDPAQIDQVLANLAVNSRDAMPRGGKLTVHTSNRTFSKEYSETHPGFASGDFVVIAVTDTGCGMDSETLDHAFEPFFTTKPEGKGTGLGLSTVYGIAQQNNGFVDISSEPGRGTTVRLAIPRYSGGEDLAKTPVVEEASPGGWETILLVEDEAPIREMVKIMLEGMGYTVLSAADPDDALVLCRKHSEALHLLFTDVIMPKMNGKELETKIRAIKPGIRTLFMSGYAANAIAHLGVLENGTCLLQKPFTMDALAKKVREVLERREQEA